jgi:hypothetical protein
MEIQMKNLIGDDILSLELVARQHHWEGLLSLSFLIEVSFPVWKLHLKTGAPNNYKSQS